MKNTSSTFNIPVIFKETTTQFQAYDKNNLLTKIREQFRIINLTLDDLGLNDKELENLSPEHKINLNKFDTEFDTLRGKVTLIKETTLSDEPVNQNIESMSFPQRTAPRRRATYDALACIQKPLIKLFEQLNIMPVVLNKLVADYLIYCITSDETQADLETKLSSADDIKEEFWQQFEGVSVLGFENKEIIIQNPNNYRQLNEWIIRNPLITCFIFNNAYLLRPDLDNIMGGINSKFLLFVLEKSPRHIDSILIDMDFSKDLGGCTLNLQNFFQCLQKQKSIKQISYKITNMQNRTLETAVCAEQIFLTIFRKNYPNQSDYTKQELKSLRTREKNYEFLTKGTNGEKLGSFYHEGTQPDSVIFNIY